MKRILVLAIGMLAIGMAFSSCYREEFPKDAIALDNGFETTTDLKSWEYGFMAAFRTAFMAEYSWNAEVQADMLNATGIFGNRMGSLYTWIGLQADDEYVSVIWERSYWRMRNLNGFLDNYNKFKFTEQKDKDDLAKVVAKCHFLRAFYYLQLAVPFSNTYNPDEPCVPLVVKYNPTAKPKRATQREVFEFILSEINEAEKVYGGVPGKISAEDVNADILNALRARTYLYMNDWANALKYSKMICDNAMYGLESDPTVLDDILTNDAESKEIMMQLYCTYPDERPRPVGNKYAFLDARRRAFVMDFLPTQGAMDMFESKDVRKKLYFAQVPVILNAEQTRTPAYVIAKYPGNPALQREGARSYWQKPKPFRTAEMYLIAAEAASKLGQDGDAATYLNALRTSRGLDPVTATGDALFKEIQDERGRELAFEGFRLWDLRRWGLPCKRMAPQNTKLLSTTPNTIELVIEPGHPKFVWPIPAHDIRSNPNLTQNPGY